MFKKKFWPSVVTLLSGLILLSVMVPKATSQPDGGGLIYLPAIFRQPPDYWIQVIGSSDEEKGQSVFAIPGGGFILVIEQGLGTDSSAVIVKLTAFGQIEWEKRVDAGVGDLDLTGHLTSDGGFILVGLGATGFNPGAQVIKLNSDGSIAWQENYGGPMLDFANAIDETTDGGYILTGYTASNANGISDIYVVKLDQNGGVQWQKSYYAGRLYAYGTDIQQTSDGGYIISGYTGNDTYDFWVLKLDSSGAVVWQRIFGGSMNDYGRAVIQAANGDYLVVGSTASAGSGGSDAWVIRISAGGNIIWQKSYGGSGTDQAFDIYQTTDGRFAIAGETSSFGSGNDDAWILLLDGSGSIVWQKSYGRSFIDSANSIQQLVNGDFLVVGHTSTGSDGDVLVMKLDANGEVGNCDLVASSTAVVTNTTFTDLSTFVLTKISPNTTSNTTFPVVNSSLQNTTLCWQ